MAKTLEDTPTETLLNELAQFPSLTNGTYDALDIVFKSDAHALQTQLNKNNRHLAQLQIRAGVNRLHQYTTTAQNTTAYYSVDHINVVLVFTDDDTVGTEVVVPSSKVCMVRAICERIDDDLTYECVTPLIKWSNNIENLKEHLAIDDYGVRWFDSEIANPVKRRLCKDDDNNTYNRIHTHMLLHYSNMACDMATALHNSKPATLVNITSDLVSILEQAFNKYHDINGTHTCQDIDDSKCTRKYIKQNIQNDIKAMSSGVVKINESQLAQLELMCSKSHVYIPR